MGEIALSTTELEELKAILGQLKAEREGPGPPIDPDIKSAAVKRETRRYETPTGTMARAMGRLGGAITGKREKQRLKSIGVDPSKGAPIYSRFVASWPADGQDQLHSQLASLMIDFGRDPSGALKFNPAQDVMWENRTENIIFRDPDTDKWHPIDPPGMDAGDLVDWTGDAFQLASEIAAVLFAVRGKGPGMQGPGRFAPRHPSVLDTATSAVKNVGIESAAAGGSGAARVEIGDYLGAYPGIPKEDVHARAVAHGARSGMLTAAGSTAMRGLGKAGKWAGNWLRKRHLPTEAYETGLALMGTETSPALQRVGSRLPEGRQMPETPGQRLQDPGLLSREQTLGRRGSAAQDIKRRQVETADDYFEDISKGFRTPAPVRPTRAGVGGAVTAAIVRPYVRTTEDIRAGVGGAMPTTMGPPLRKVAEKKRKEFSDWAKKEYDALRTETGGIEIKPVFSVAFAKENQDLLSRDVIPMLTIENQQMLKEFLDQAIKTTVHTRPHPKLLKTKEVTPPVKFKKHTIKEINFPQFQRLISQLKTLERQLDVKPIGGVDSKLVRDFRKEIIKDRDATIQSSGDPELIKRFYDLETEYAIRKSELNDTVLGQILKFQGGAPRIKDENVFRSVFGPGKISEAKLMAGILDDPKHVLERREMIQAIGRDYLDKAAPLGVINPRDHARWMRDHESILDIWLRPNERKSFDSIDDINVLLRGIEDSQEKFLRTITDTFGDITNINPSTIIDNALSNPAKMEQLVARLADPATGDREVLHMFQDLAVDIFKKRITGRNKYLGREALSFDKLEKQLGDDKLMESMRALHGDEYVSNLGVLQDALEVTQREGAYRATASPNAFIDFISKYQFLRGPLDKWAYRAGRIGRAYGSGMESNFMRIMLDPDELAKMTNLALTTNKSRQAQMLLGSLGLKYFTDALGADPEAAAQLNIQQTGIAIPKSVLKLQLDIRSNPELLKKLTR